MAYRYDLAKFSPKTRTTPQGFLRAPAAFTREGVFTYHRADGTKVLELRPADEVFDPASMATLSGAPLVELHPKEGMVTPSNVKSLSIGHASEVIERSDTLLTGEVTVEHADAIEKVKSKELSEISLGYNCTIDPTPGVHPVHGRYDQIQRNIRYNHVALGPPDWGRAGSEVAIRLDSDGIAKGEDFGVSCDRHETPPRGDALGKDMRKMETLTIGGVAYEVSSQAAQAFRHHQERADSNSAKLRSSLETLQGRHDALAEENKKLREQLAEAEDPARLDSAVKARMCLETDARKVLGEDAELPASDREIREVALRHDCKDLDLSGKSDGYVAARFDQLISDFSRRAPPPGEIRRDALRAEPPGLVGSEKARQDMIERSRQAWQQPLAVTNGQE